MKTVGVSQVWDSCSREMWRYSNWFGDVSLMIIVDEQIVILFTIEIMIVQMCDRMERHFTLRAKTGN
jgi:hypothetical protein